MLLPDSKTKVKWIGRPADTTYTSIEPSECGPHNLCDDFRPLAILSKISLVLPIKNVFRKSDSFKFSYISVEIISVIVVNLFIGYVLPTQISYVDETPNRLKEALAFLISNCWFLIGQEIFLLLIDQINYFDHSLTLYAKVKYFKKKSKMVWPVLACVYPMLLAVFVGWSEYRDEPCLMYRCPKMEIIRGFFCYQHHVQMVIYMFLCYELKMRFKTMNVIFYDFVKTNYLGKDIVTDNFADFEKQRLQFAHLIKCTKTLNKLYGWRFTFMLALLILHNIWLLYYFYTKEGYIITGYDMLISAYSFTLLLGLTHLTDQLVMESQKMASFLTLIPTQLLDWASMFQLDHTLHQCEMFQVNISASGMVTVDKSLLLGMAGAITMYFIAILQMATTTGSFVW